MKTGGGEAGTRYVPLDPLGTPVRIASTPETNELGIAGLRGELTGLWTDETVAPQPGGYLIRIPEQDAVFALGDDEVIWTQEPTRATGPMLRLNLEEEDDLPHGG
ncbi:MAG: hypothetical protein GEV11_19565 [Streptosporangiales bacterium]|nr:hypothetical protein [Streptosporangiales bacterium]